MARWTPPGQDPVTFHTLVDGIPPWMTADVKQWLEEATAAVDLRAMLRAYDRDSRRGDPLSEDAQYGILAAFEALDESEELDFVEYVVYHLNHTGDPEAYDLGDALDSVLATNSSKWTVGIRNGHAGFEERVPEGVADAVDAVADGATSPGRLLAEAWGAAFGRSPDYEDAYEKAIKAVEESAASVVSPSNLKATLGTMVAQMEQQTNPPWRLPLEEDPRHPSDATVTQMMRSLWHGQPSRHGGNGYRAPTREEAEAAVLLAVPLVQWFESGVVSRRP